MRSKERSNAGCRRQCFSRSRCRDLVDTTSVGFSRQEVSSRAESGGCRRQAKKQAGRDQVDGVSSFFGQRDGVRGFFELRRTKGLLSGLSTAAAGGRKKGLRGGKEVGRRGDLAGGMSDWNVQWADDADKPALKRV